MIAGHHDSACPCQQREREREREREKEGGRERERERERLSVSLSPPQKNQKNQGGGIQRFTQSHKASRHEQSHTLCLKGGKKNGRQKFKSRDFMIGGKEVTLLQDLDVVVRQIYQQHVQPPVCVCVCVCVIYVSERE